MANIIFEVGDWSGDGHAYSAQYLVEVNKSLEQLREIHFKENHFIGSLCKEYEENYIYVNTLYEFIFDKTNHEKAVELINNFIKNENGEVEVHVDNDSDENIELDNISYKLEDEHTITIHYPDSMLNLWLMLLKVIDDSLQYKVLAGPMSQYYIKYKGYPVEPDGTMHFYGYDKQNRHLDTPGYGVWSSDNDTEYYHGD